MGRVRVGVLGGGRMGRNHCRVYSMLRHAEFVGICDQNREAGEKLASQYDAHFFAEPAEMLEAVDAVSIATPTPSHFELAMLCLRHGKHVLVEKPMTETLEQAHALVSAAQWSGRVVQVGHIERFNPTYTELKHILANLTPLAINFRRLSPYAGSNTDVDVVLDLMIHDLDLLLDLTKESALTYDASGFSALSGEIDHVLATIQLTDGPLYMVNSSRVTEQKVRVIEVTAKEAYVEADLLSKSILIHHSTIGEYRNYHQQGVQYRQEGVVERIHVPIAEPLFLELQHFLDCVRLGMEPLVSAQQGAATLELAMGIRAAVQAQQPNRMLLSAKSALPLGQTVPVA